MIQVGHTVRHDRFGMGKVVDIIHYPEGRSYCAVDFKNQDTTMVPLVELS